MSDPQETDVSSLENACQQGGNGARASERRSLEKRPERAAAPATNFLGITLGEARLTATTSPANPLPNCLTTPGVKMSS